MIPFVDLSRDKKLNEEIKRACSRVIDNGWFILGPELEKFEGEFAKYCGKNNCIGVGNGTDAITIALRAYDIGKGDEVITVPNTAIPTVAAIINSGAKPVLVDVGDDFLMNPSLIEKAITPKTKAIIPVHLYGQACDMDKILKIAGKNNLKAIEDCAQAHGAEYYGKKVPIGEIGCFSFYPSKNLGCYGDGGAIVTDAKEIEEKTKQLRNYGQVDRYHARIHGQNSRLDEIQSAILQTRLEHLDEFNQSRRKNAIRYDSLLENLVETPIERNGNYHVYHLYVIKTGKRDELANCLKEKGIGTAIHYPIAIHLQEAYKSLGYKEGDFPRAEKYSKEILSLPMFPDLKIEEIKEVCDAIKSFK